VRSHEWPNHAKEGVERKSLGSGLVRIGDNANAKDVHPLAILEAP
jgi:hypothetical protein